MAADYLEIAGAGPAGLAAAMAATRLGKNPRVYERRGDVGGRFHGDFQGLENWVWEQDVLEQLEELGITTQFEHTPFQEILCFGPGGRERVARSSKPLFYLVRRGSSPGTLDAALKDQAFHVGVEIEFGVSARHFEKPGVVCQGPHRADAIAVGYLFESDMTDIACASVRDDLAPKGYAYLLVCQGRGTVATCMFDDFHREDVYLRRTVEFFEKAVGLRMQGPRRFGGNGNFFIPPTVRKNTILFAGEAAGLQDPLFGFGIRTAILSGHAAGTALARGRPEEYVSWWKKTLRPHQQAGMANRWFYNRMGDRGYAKLIDRYRDGEDLRERLHQTYAARWWRRVWYRLVASRTHASLLELRDDCDCTWCRCARHASPGPRAA